MSRWILGGLLFGLLVMGGAVGQALAREDVVVAPAQGALPAGTHAYALGPCRVTVAVPERWNGRVLLYNHGLVFEDLPLSAKLEVERDPYATLLREGWLLAATSYRRNGIVVRDAMDDVEALRLDLEARFGAPRGVYLLGSSMGGAISVRLLETRAEVYAGAVVQGRGLLVQDPKAPGEPSYAPGKPVLFLTNRDEMAEPRAYAETALAESGLELPLWTVAREGHINFLPAEELAAVRALVAWAEAGVVPPAWHDITGERPAAPSSATWDESGAAFVKVAAVTEPYGNLILALVPEDLARLGLERGDTLVIGVGERLILAPWVATFSDVPAGGWLAYQNAELRFGVAINRGNAASTLGLAPGATVRVAKADLPRRGAPREEPGP